MPRAHRIAERGGTRHGPVAGPSERLTNDVSVRTTEIAAAAGGAGPSDDDARGLRIGQEPFPCHAHPASFRSAGDGSPGLRPQLLPHCPFERAYPISEMSSQPSGVTEALSPRSSSTVVVAVSTTAGPVMR